MPGSLVRAGARRARQVALDAAVALRRRHRGVFGLQPRIGRRHLLRRRVVRHQRIDHGRGGDGGDGDLVDAIDERAPVDLAVDVQVVGLDGLGGNLRFCRLHGECSVYMSRSRAVARLRRDAADNNTGQGEIDADIVNRQSQGITSSGCRSKAPTSQPPLAGRGLSRWSSPPEQTASGMRSIAGTTVAQRHSVPDAAVETGRAETR